MPDVLENTRIYRGGATASKLNFETSHCTFETSSTPQGIDLRFTMASKGGGYTAVSLQIGMAGLSEILQAIATEMPKTSTMFLECASIANKRNVDHIVEGRRASNKLVKVKEFVDEKYREAPIGQDEREGKAASLLSEVIGTPRELD